MVDGARALYGRAAELARLNSLYDRVVADGSMTLVVGGEGGIGKTSLVDAFLGSRDDVVHVGRGVCSAHDFHPTASLEPLLSIAGRSASDLLDDMEVPSAQSTPEAALARRTRTLADAARAFVHAVGSIPSVFVLDDLHWASPVALDFVGMLADELKASKQKTRVLLVVVSRILPPPHPLAQLLTTLERRVGVERIDVEALEGDAVGRIVDGLVDTRPSGAFVDVVLRSARGNPLHAYAAVRALALRGVTAQTPMSDERTWAALRFPLALEDPVAGWIAGLPDDDRRILGCAAVLGTDSTVPALATVADRGREAVSATVRSATGGGLLATDGQRFWFSHGVFREALYDDLDPTERQSAHLRCARLLDGAAATPAAAVAVGHHVMSAGDLAPPVERARALTRAGRASLQLTMWADAARYLEAALSVVDHRDAGNDDVLAMLGRAYYFAHDVDAATDRLRAAVDDAAARGDEANWADALVMLMRLTTASNPSAWRRPQDDAPARAFLDAARDPSRRALVLQVLAEGQTVAGRLDEAEATADQAVALARDGHDGSVLALATYAQAFTDMTAMRVAQGLDRVEEAVRHSNRGDDWFVRSIMNARLPFPLLATGRLGDADTAAEISIADAQASHEYSNQALGLSVRAQAALLRGDLSAADRLAGEAAQATRRSEYVLADLFVAPTLIVGHVYQGRAEEARTVARDWPNLPRSMRAALAEWVDAVAFGVMPAGPMAIRLPSPVTQVAVGVFAARVETGIRAGSVDQLDEAAAALEEWTADGLDYAPSFPVSLTRVRGELLVALGRFDDGVALLDQAIRQTSGAGAHIESARSAAALARALAQRAGGRTDEASERAVQAAIVARRTGLSLRVLRVDHLLPGEYGNDSGGYERRPIMITDIVGSTAVSNDLGDVAYLELVLRHHDIVRSVLRRWAGTEFSEAGDGLLAWFDDVERALRAAVDIQHTIRMTHGSASGPMLEVRISIAGGDPLFHGGRPYGLVVNRAARILTVAGPGQIVVDENVSTSLPSGFSVVESSQLDLKGVGRQTVSVVATAGSGLKSPPLDVSEPSVPHSSGEV